MLTVACIRVGDRYGPEYPATLRRMVARHLSEPYRFVCVTEHEWDGERMEPEPGLPGWWQKVALFKPGRFSGRVLFLDLDIVVLGCLDPLVQRAGNWIMKDPWAPTFNSSVMTWDAGTADHIYTSFRPTVMQRINGDQDWITLISEWQTYDPDNEVVSFKGCGGQRKGVVSVFHGEPKPHQLGGWVKQEWC